MITYIRWESDAIRWDEVVHVFCCSYWVYAVRTASIHCSHASWVVGLMTFINYLPMTARPTSSFLTESLSQRCFVTGTAFWLTTTDWLALCTCDYWAASTLHQLHMKAFWKRKCQRQFQTRCHAIAETTARCTQYDVLTHIWALKLHKMSLNGNTVFIKKLTSFISGLLSTVK